MPFDVPKSFLSDTENTESRIFWKTMRNILVRKFDLNILLV